MSCENCDEDCEKAADILQRPLAYVRVGNGNVLIIGCHLHLKELINKLRDSTEI